MKSFLTNIQTYFKIQPQDQQTKNLAEKIRPKCEVLYFPIDLPTYTIEMKNRRRSSNEIIHIVWPHRW